LLVEALEGISKMTETPDSKKSKINCGTYTLTQKHKGISVIWNILHSILKEDESAVEGWLFCSTCRKVLKVVAGHTSNLSRHKCCMTLSQPREVTKVSATDKAEAIEKCSQWIVQDCQPFSSVAGPGYKSMVQFFIKIGAAYGDHIDVDDLLPSPSTLSRKVHKDAEEKKGLISSEIQIAADTAELAATVDM